MKIATEVYVSIMIIVIGIVLLLQIFALSIQADNANTYLRNMCSRFEFVQLSTATVHSYIEEAEELGYELQYQEFSNIIRGCESCGYVLGELELIDLCTLCGCTDILEKDYQYGKLKLGYELSVQVLGIRKNTYITAYVR